LQKNAEVDETSKNERSSRGGGCKCWQAGKGRGSRTGGELKRARLKGEWVSKNDGGHSVREDGNQEVSRKRGTTKKVRPESQRRQQKKDEGGKEVYLKKLEN